MPEKPDEKDYTQIMNRLLILVSVVVILVVACNKGMSRQELQEILSEPDNPIEEIAEWGIHQATGIDIDLSPGTPE